MGSILNDIILTFVLFKIVMILYVLLKHGQVIMTILD